MQMVEVVGPLVPVLAMAASLMVVAVAGVVALLEVGAVMEALVEAVQEDNPGIPLSQASQTTPTSKP